MVGQLFSADHASPRARRGWRCRSSPCFPSHVPPPQNRNLERHEKYDRRQSGMPFGSLKRFQIHISFCWQARPSISYRIALRFIFLTPVPVQAFSIHGRHRHGQAVGNLTALALNGRAAPVAAATRRFTRPPKRGALPQRSLALLPASLTLACSKARANAPPHPCCARPQGQLFCFHPVVPAGRLREKPPTFGSQRLAPQTPGLTVPILFLLQSLPVFRKLPAD